MQEMRQARDETREAVQHIRAACTPAQHALKPVAYSAAQQAVRINSMQSNLSSMYSSTAQQACTPAQHAVKPVQRRRERRQAHAVLAQAQRRAARSVL